MLLGKDMLFWPLQQYGDKVCLLAVFWSFFSRTEPLFIEGNCLSLRLSLYQDRFVQVKHVL